MKKLTLLLAILFCILVGNSANALYIWQDFDNPGAYPPVGWTTTTAQVIYTWDWAVRCSGYGLGYGCVKADFSDANSGIQFDLLSPTFGASVAGDSLSFDHAYSPLSGYPDKIIVLYSTNGGSTWGLIDTLNAAALTTAPSSYAPFVPIASQWATKKYALVTGTNKIKFNAVSGYGNNCYLDNIKIGTKYSNDVGAVGFSRFVKAFLPNTIDTPKVFVRNFGTAAQTFPVTVTITPGSYSQTLTVSNLAPGAFQQVAFPPITATSSAGNYVYKAYSALTTDLNKSNDTIANTFIVSTNPKNVMMEYCTGTWCQWCPCGEQELTSLTGYLPNAVIFAYHGGGSSDPWQTFNGNNILSLMSMTSFPTGTPERLTLPANVGFCGFFDIPFHRTLDIPVAPVKIDIVTLNFNSGTRVLNVGLNATALSNLTGTFKINYVITEDNLLYTQTGNAYCTGGSNFVHSWVVRNMVNGATGDALNTGGTWNTGVSFNKSFSTTIDASWAQANCKISVFVYKDASPLYTAEIQQAMRTSILLTGVNDPKETPLKYELMQNYPNPFNPVTSIKFSVPKYGFASLKIYDVTGKLVATYLEDYIQPGIYNAEFDGSSFASGVYFYTLKTNEYTETKKMMLVK